MQPIHGLIDGFRRHVNIGNTALARLPPAIRESLLIRSPITVQSFAEDEARNTTLVIDDRRVAFDSPIISRDWQNIARAVPPGDLRTDQDLLIYTRNVADRIIREESFRTRFPSAAAWFDSLAANVQPTGHQGLVIGGRTLGAADISGNRIEGFAVALQIGLSHSDPGRQSFDIANSITIRDNDMFLRVPVERDNEAFGLFIGNAERVRIDGNQIRWAAGRQDRMNYFEAGRIYGRMGPFVMFKDNLIDIEATALRMTHTGPAPSNSDVQWRGGSRLASSISEARSVSDVRRSACAASPQERRIPR